MIKTKSTYDLVEESDGERILVSRYWPRGLSKERLSAQHLSNLAPTRELLRDWKAKEISWDEYKARYLREMSSQQDKIKEIAEEARHKTMTLLCFEKEENPCCHRHLLKRLMDKQK